MAVYTPPEKENRKMADGLTKMGYDEIFNRIVNRSVKPPQDLTVEMLNEWLNGYAQCQDDILTIISSMKDQYGR